MATYRPMRFARPLQLLIFGGMFAGVVGTVVTTSGEPEAPSPGFTVLWVASIAWAGYWWLRRTATVLRLKGHDLVWEAPLASGRVPIGSLTATRPMRLASNVQVLEHTGGRPVLAPVAKGLSAFIDEVVKLHPGLPVSIGWQGRLLDRLPGRSRFE